jgi:hypothetical protein
VVKKSSLLKEFLSERVVLLTNVLQSIQLDDGQLGEMPLILEGIFVDFDNDWVLLAADEGSPPELVAIREIVSIRIVDLLAEVSQMDSPNKKDMN